MKTKTLLVYILYYICCFKFVVGQMPIDTLTQVTTTFNAGAKSVVDNMNNRIYTYTIGQISGRALIRPDQSYEIGFVHCNSCKLVSSNLPDLSSVIKIYPTPAKNFLALESEYPSDLKYKLRSIFGQTLISGVLRDKELIGISHLSEGFYLLVFYNDSGKTLWIEKISKK